MTEYRFDPGLGKHGNLALARYNVTARMDASDTPVTSAESMPMAARG